ncbi:beta-ketoacyl synthase N-terminal-like domain-containing protein [Chryseolinea sp. T2]|uniref:beta-ketoacyl synthase N-terminal-like domain-containing protein n=1 Tax=Chryseolinea sp. T2 TaxID=3129255 RepID=UPI0030785A54
MSCYINGIGAISPQKQLTIQSLLSEPVSYDGDRLTCIEPDYTAYYDVRQLRRMSRIIRLGMTAGLDALREAGIKVPDGIITGTGYGCLDDTGIFLSKMIENKEHALNPTPFIQSTHNTIGSQLALLLQCQGYNQTYTQRGLSFENALNDALMMIAEDPTQRLLAGSADEITSISHNILRRFDLYRRDNTSSLDLFSSSGGSLNGEGAAYFLLSSTAQQGAVQLKAVQSFYKPSPDVLEEGILQFARTHMSSPDDIDVVFAGKCGDASLDSGIDLLLERTMPKATLAVFKHLTGEFPGASAIAAAIACRVIQSGSIPSVLIQRDSKRQPRNILIYNRYLDTYHSLILLAAT